MRRFSSSKMLDLLNDQRFNLSGLARSSKIAPSTINKIKAGSVPSANTLVALADCMGKPLDYFFEEEIHYSEKMSEWPLGDYIQHLLEKKGGKKAGRHAKWLADESGISPGYVNYLIHGEASGKKGKPRPTIDMILALSKALNVSPMNFIIAYDGDDPDEQPTSDIESYRYAFKAMIKELPSNEKRQLLMEMPAQELVSLMPDDITAEILRRAQEGKPER